MAEAVFMQMVVRAGLQNEIEVDSAGTGDWHIGERPHHGTLEILARNGVPTDSRARQIHIRDLEEFDTIVVMDDSNGANVASLGNSRARVVRLLDLVPEIEDKQVPDPYFTGDFEGVHDLVQRGCAALLEHICAGHALTPQK